MKVKRLMVGAIALVGITALTSIAFAFAKPACADSGSCGECTTNGNRPGFWAYDYSRKTYRCAQCDGRI